MNAARLLAGPLAGLAALALIHAASAQDGRPPAQPASIPGVGEVLVDADNRTLYVSSADEANAGVSNCYDECAATWPPAVVQGPLSGRSNLGTFLRSDGSVQLTWQGKPLYRYSGDGAPGQVTGDGVSEFGATWSVARATPNP